jgi:NADH-quinone oxidoreductase subunit J
MGHPVFFYSLSTLMLAGALGVILARNPVYAVLSLVATLFALSGLFVLLEAYFVATILILVYAGAILVLFLFVVMLLDLAPETIFHIQGGTLRLSGTLFGIFFLREVVVASGAFAPPPTPPTGPPMAGSTAAIGKLLFTTTALPFEVASLLLLVGIIGAIVLAKKRL